MAPLNHTPKSEKKKNKKEEENNAMNNLIHQRDQIKRRVTNINNALEEAEDDPAKVSASLLKVFEKKLELHYQEYAAAHREVLSITPSTKVEEQDEIQMAFDRLHTEALGRIEGLFETVISTPKQTNNHHVIIQQQPLRAPIPIFDGKMENWPKFRTMFEDIVVRSSDSDALKLHHLDKALVSDASGWITVKMIQDNNFQQTWKQLKDQFENPRVIVETHIAGLLELNPVIKRNHTELQELLKTVNRHIGGLEYQGIRMDEMSSLLLTKLITSRLDDNTLQIWERMQEHGKLPNLEQTLKFLQSESQVLERFQTRHISIHTREGNSKPSIMRPTSQKVHAATPSIKIQFCSFCSEEHRHYECPIFNKWSTTQRIAKVKELKLCFNCLRIGHRFCDCSSNKTCSKCQRKHHTLLHEDTKHVTQENTHLKIQQEHASVRPLSNTAVPNNHQLGHKTGMLMTAVVNLIDHCNRKTPCRALLDAGSQVNFISKAMADRLSVVKIPTLVPVTGIGAARTCAREKINIVIESRSSNFSTMVECLVIPKVTGVIPNKFMDISKWPLPSEIFLADPEFNTPGQIDMLLGISHFIRILKAGRMQLREDLPDLQETHLGWVVAGNVEEQQNFQQCYITTETTLSETMKKFWEVEEGC